MTILSRLHINAALYKITQEVYKAFPAKDNIKFIIIHSFGQNDSELRKKNDTV